MKKRFVLVLLGSTPLFGAQDTWQMLAEMDQQMHEMHQQMQQAFSQMAQAPAKSESPDYKLQMKEKDDAVLVSLELPKTVKLDNISVELEDDMLDVVIEHEGKIELKISGQMVTVSAAKIMKHEQKDAQGKTHVVSAGTSQMMQSFGLPARVDFQRMAPHADLTDGLLTITLAKKGGSQKIQVTSSQALAVPDKKDTK